MTSSCQQRSKFVVGKERASHHYLGPLVTQFIVAKAQHNDYARCSRCVVFCDDTDDINWLTVLCIK